VITEWISWPWIFYVNIPIALLVLAFIPALMPAAPGRVQGTEFAALLHRGEHVARAHQHLSDFIAALLIEGARDGEIRDDVAPGELANYCLHALSAAGSLPSKAAVRRLVAVTMAGLRRQPPG